MVPTRCTLAGTNGTFWRRSLNSAHELRKADHMNTKKLVSLFAAVIALAMVAAACGGGASSDQEVIDAMAEQLRAEGDIPADVDVDCMSTAMVEGMGGAAELEEKYGLTAESIREGAEPDDVELPRAEAIAMADDMLDCGLEQIMIEGMTQEGDMSQEDAACLLENIPQESIRDQFAAEFMSAAEGDALSQEANGTMMTSMFEAVTECDLDLSSLLGS